MTGRPALEHIEQAARGIDPEAWGETVESRTLGSAETKTRGEINGRR